MRLITEKLSAITKIVRSKQTERKCVTKINAKELGQTLFQKANNGYALEKHPIKVVVHLDVTLAIGAYLQKRKLHIIPAKTLKHTGTAGNNSIRDI